MHPTDPATARRRRLVTRAAAALALVAAGAGTFVACSDAPLGVGRAAPALGSDERVAATADHAKSPDERAQYGWVGETHNAAMRALTGSIAAKLTGRPADERCATVRAAVAEYVRSGRLLDGHGQPITVAGDVAQALAAPDGGGFCNTPETDKLRFSAAVRQLTVGRATTYLPSPEALALIDQMEYQASVALSADGLSAALTPLEAQAHALEDPTDRAVVLTAASTGRASAYNVEQNPPTPPAPPPSDGPPVHDQGIGRAGWREALRDVARADIRGCVVGGIVGGLTSGLPGVVSGCAVGGVTSSLDKAAEHVM